MIVLDMDVFNIADIHHKILSFIEFQQLCSICKLVSKLGNKHASNNVCVTCLDFDSHHAYISNTHFHSHNKSIKSHSALKKSRSRMNGLCIVGEAPLTRFLSLTEINVSNSIMIAN